MKLILVSNDDRLIKSNSRIYRFRNHPCLIPNPSFLSFSLLLFLSPSPG